MLQVDAGRQVSASFAVCTQHKVCPVIGKGNKGWSQVPLLSALIAERVTNLCKASFGEWYSLREHDFSSHDHFERGRRRDSH